MLKKKQSKISDKEVADALNKVLDGIEAKYGSRPNMRRVNFIPGDKISVSYKLNQFRPGYSQLTTYVDDTNPTNVFTGNPNLDNVSNHTFSLLYSGMQPGNITFSCTFSNNAISRVWYLDGEGRSVQTYANSGKFRRFSLSYSKSFKFKGNNIFSFSSNGSYSNEEVSDKRTERYSVNSSVSYNKSLFGGRLNLNNRLFYMNLWNIGNNGYKSDETFRMLVSLESWSKFGKGNVVYYGLSFNDILNWKSRTRSFINNEDFEERSVSYRTNIPISVYASVNFGSFKAKPVRKAKREAVIKGFSD